MSDWAANDYEPTPDEIANTFGGVFDEPGHGEITMIASMERYIWQVEGVYWGHREVLPDGRVGYSWFVPERDH